MKPYLWGFQKILVQFALNTRYKMPTRVIWPWDKKNTSESFILFHLSDWFHLWIHIIQCINTPWVLHPWLDVGASRDDLHYSAGCWLLFFVLKGVDRLISPYCFLSLMAYPANSFFFSLQSCMLCDGPKICWWQHSWNVAGLVGTENNDTFKFLRFPQSQHSCAKVLFLYWQLTKPQQSRWGNFGTGLQCTQNLKVPLWSIFPMVKLSP